MLAPEGPELGAPDPLGGSAPLPGLDLGAMGPGSEIPGLSEENKLSINDENAPIKVQNMIDELSSIAENEDNKNEKDLTEFEEWQIETQKDAKTKRKKARHSISDNMSSTYQRTRKQNDVSGMPRLKSDMKALINPVRNLSKDAMLNEEEWDISEYLDSKIIQNAKMTSRLQSTLKRFDGKFGKSLTQSIISENNSSGDEDDET